MRTSILVRWLVQKRFPVLSLRLLWVITILWFEIGATLYSSLTCKWPNLSNDSTNVFVVADPQILDSHSYPGRPSTLTYLSQLIVDLNMRKSWRAITGVGKYPDTIIFLGDMMDNGRLNTSQKEYERYYNRFHGIFKTFGQIPVYYLPGNHDIDLSLSHPSTQDRERFISHFGPLNQVFKVSNHTIVLLDSPGLVEEDHQRARLFQSYDSWQPKPDGTVAFVEHISTEGTSNVILFTHIPLFRPDDSSCGPLREKGTIRQGGGIYSGYQNTLSSQASDFLLENLRPSVIFSGDDHDVCEYLHTSNGQLAMEVTVKSFSIAMGIRQPGYLLLSLTSHAYDYKICLLPDQLGIYLSIYTPLLVLSILILAFSNVLRVRLRDRLSLSLPTSPVDDPVLLKMNELANRSDHNQHASTSSFLAVPTSATYHRRWRISRLFFSRSSRSTRSILDRTFITGLIYDMGNIASQPLGLFIFISWWMTIF